MAIGWPAESRAFWSYALRRPLAVESIVSLTAALGLTWGPLADALERELGSGYVFWVRAAAWAVLILAAAVYAPGRLIADYKATLGHDYYRLDPDAAIDKAYRQFDRLLRKGRMFQAATIVQRREWDVEARRMMAEFCDENCVLLYLMNTGRLHDVHPIDDDFYEAALDHVESLLNNQLKRYIKWPPA